MHFTQKYKEQHTIKQHLLKERGSTLLNHHHLKYRYVVSADTMELFLVRGPKKMLSSRTNPFT